MSSLSDKTTTTLQSLSNCHPVFHNQPPYTFYNKLFEVDYADALFLTLNDIHPSYGKDDKKEDKTAACGDVLIDPRTHQRVNASYDHTTKKNDFTKHLRCNIRSNLNRDEHVKCLRAFLALQDKRPVNKVDLFVWEGMTAILAEERQLVQQAALLHATNRKEEMYAPAKPLVAFYKQWYAKKTQMLLRREPDTPFNTHSGLPHVRVCKSFTQPKSDVVQVRLLARTGYVPLCDGTTTDFGFPKFYTRLDTFANMYSDSMTAAPEEHLLRNDIEHHLALPDDGETDIVSTRFLIPLDALLFLLVAGEYIDLPTEVMLEINSVEPNEETKVIRFKSLLPARQCGWHTHNQSVEQAFAAFSSVPGNRKWLRLTNDKVAPEPKLATADICGCPMRNYGFKPMVCDDYMEGVNTQRMKPPFETKTNEALVNWRLKESETENSLNIYTTFELPPARRASGAKFFGSHSIKLEYKPEFGCEIMTKYELLKIWLQMTLLSGFTATEFGICSRLIIEDFGTLMEEHVTLASVEQKLLNIYNVDMSKLLSNLGEFLNLLSSMAAGKYMLRYNPKFADKLMLCSPAQEITQNTVFLHALLKTEPSDLFFTSQPHHLPIDENLCSNIHRQLQMVPCSFRPKDKKSSGAPVPMSLKKKWQAEALAAQKIHRTVGPIDQLEFAKKYKKKCNKRKRKTEQGRALA